MDASRNATWLTWTALTILFLYSNPVTAVSCTPAGFEGYHSTENCSSPALLFIPLVLSNFVVFAASILFSRLKFQNKIRFFGEEKDYKDPWRPWSGLSTALLLVVQALATAALIRAGGYNASFGNLALLWLLRPRMQWAVMFFYACFGKDYKRAATDAFFAEGLLSLLSLPILAWFLSATLGNDCLDVRYDSELEFGTNSNVYGLFWSALMAYLPAVAVEVLIFVTFFWPGHRSLHRGWSGGAAFWDFCIFGFSWWFWTRERSSPFECHPKLTFDHRMGRFRRKRLLRHEYWSHLSYSRHCSVR